MTKPDPVACPCAGVDLDLHDAGQHVRGDVGDAAVRALDVARGCRAEVRPVDGDRAAVVVGEDVADRAAGAAGDQRERDGTRRPGRRPACAAGRSRAAAQGVRWSSGVGPDRAL